MTLILLPNLLHADAREDLGFPGGLREVAAKLDGLIAESPKEGRVFLKRMGRVPLEVPQKELSEHTTSEEIDQLVEPMKRGEAWGFVSDAGIPCLADPGAKLVARARQQGIVVQAICGPSSIMLILMLSGFSAQNFSFLGYLPRDGEDLKKAIKTMEKRMREEKQTQVFIETPYRNEKLLQALLQNLGPEIKLCVACNLTAPDESIVTKEIAKWRQMPLPSLKDKPAIFALSLI
jgi:16S rRNA (cytidine1402-2'-O)-methyltransferase